MVNHFYRDNKDRMQRQALKAIAFDPERLMRSSFEKMIRAAGLNLERAWLAWKMQHICGDRNRLAMAKRNVAAANLVNAIDKKRKNLLRAGHRRLADGVALTNTQSKILNRFATVAFGK
jgi:hypothetical protein